ncbi:MAG: polyprenol monophosphomannose synthase [Deltaproteobacteria bacterium]|nr:polyprenol monophosphomannose synthase [Deltaproteobacteria bacterium]
MERCIAVIPTFNEAENLPLLVPRVLAQGPQVELLIVDDASPDGTGKIADEIAESNPRVHVLHRAAKEGLGPAYRAGLARALELGADVIVQMDADFSHPPETLPQMFRELEEYDVVMGSRYVNGITVVNWPIERILLSYFGNWYVRKVTGLPITDVTGGFRCMRRNTLERIANYRLSKSGAKIKEIEFFFLDRTRGTSKLTMQTGFETLWLAWWLRIADFLGRL